MAKFHKHERKHSADHTSLTANIFVARRSAHEGQAQRHERGSEETEERTSGETKVRKNKICLDPRSAP